MGRVSVGGMQAGRRFRKSLRAMPSPCPGLAVVSKRRGPSFQAVGGQAVVKQEALSGGVVGQSSRHRHATVLALVVARCGSRFFGGRASDVDRTTSGGV